jgi:predicted nucleotidyltransferase
MPLLKRRVLVEGGKSERRGEMAPDRQDIIGRERALSLLRSCKHDVEQRYGVTAIGLFGSIARDQETETSDIDVVVQLQNPDLYTLVHIKEDLEAAFHRHVDVIHYRARMNPYLKRCIEEDAVYV